MDQGSGWILNSHMLDRQIIILQRSLVFNRKWKR